MCKTAKSGNVHVCEYKMKLQKSQICGSVQNLNAEFVCNEGALYLYVCITSYLFLIGNPLEYVQKRPSEFFGLQKRFFLSCLSFGVSCLPRCLLQSLSPGSLLPCCGTSWFHVCSVVAFQRPCRSHPYK